MKRYFFILMSLSLSIASLNAEPWTGGISEPSNDGVIYTIATPEQLAWVAVESQTSDFAGKVIRLTDDLDMGGTQETPAGWTPIGSETVPFQGEIDGNKHVIYNLYLLSSLFPKGVGLVAYAGENAMIHHLGIAQGQIMTDATNNVGSFVGVNKGTVHHCFNMTQIIAHNGDNIGGLVGTNYGKIEYAYNAGIITDGNNHVGGLVGYNMSTAVLDNCYNMGYCKGSDHVGALFGKNEAPESQLNKVVFDQQLTRMYATGYGANDPILTDNTKYAIENSDIFRRHTSPFYENPAVTWGDGYHPQLLCFKNHPASWLSTFAIGLDAENRPIERAEGVGAPKEGNEPRKTIWIQTLKNNLGVGQWYSPSPEVILIENPSGDKAQVFRPCGNQEVILTQTYGEFVKQVYTNVKGYEVFDAGILDGDAFACWNQEEVKFMANNGGKEASGGKDDEQKNFEKSYQYMIIRDTVIRRFPLETLPLDTFYMNQETYKDWWLPTDVPGEYAFRRYVKDYRCKTEWTVSKGKENAAVGYLFLHVREKFDPGELVEKADTLYVNLPYTFPVLSARDASGGGHNFKYTWILKRETWDPETQEWLLMDPDEDIKNPLYIGGTAVNTPSFDYQFAKPGKYSFTRMVSETSCEAAPQESLRPHEVYVYSIINPGEIDAFERELCTPLCTDTINEIAPVEGGNGIYTYRWLCNGEPIPDSDTTALLLENVPMQNNSTYIFTRQVKDNTGLMDWLTSEGQVRVRVYKDYDAGALQNTNELLCTDAGAIEDIAVNIAELTPANGETGSEFVYCWLLYRGGEDTLLLDTLHYNTPALSTTLALSSYGLSMPATVFVKRAVQNLLCQTEWKISENAAVWRFGQNEEQTSHVNICERDLPYNYAYTFADGHTQNFLFTSANQRFELTDLTETGCPLAVTLVSQVSPVPSVETEPEVSLCETAGALRIVFTILDGAPDRFDLTFSQSAKELGFRDSINAVLPTSGVIIIPVPETLPLGKHSMSIVFYAEISSSEECKKSAPQTIQFSIDMDGFVHRKENEVVFVDNSGKHNDEGLTFVAYQWYLNGEIMEGETGQFHYEYNGLNGFYQVVMTGADGREYRSCVYEFRPTTPVENVEAEGKGRKILKDGRLLILIDNKMYNALGQEEKQ